MKHDLVSLNIQQRQIARRERDRRRGRLGTGRFDGLVKELAGVIRLTFEAGATATLFGLEGPLRHGIRSDLCLQGWDWPAADAMAKELMDEAFRVVRAIRPTWNEGQPEWAIEAGTLIERTRCVRCHKPLPEGHHKFCSNVCTSAHHSFWAYRKAAQEDHALALAAKTI